MASVHWQLLVGCGDRTLRLATVCWPVKGAPPKLSEPDEDGTGGGPGAEAAEALRGGGRGDRLHLGRPLVPSSYMLWRGVPEQVLCAARHPASARECPGH